MLLPPPRTSSLAHRRRALRPAASPQPAARLVWPGHAAPRLLPGPWRARARHRDHPESLPRESDRPRGNDVPFGPVVRVCCAPAEPLRQARAWTRSRRSLHRRRRRPGDGECVEHASQTSRDTLTCPLATRVPKSSVLLSLLHGTTIVRASAGVPPHSCGKRRARPPRQSRRKDRQGAAESGLVADPASGRRVARNSPSP